MAAASLSLEQGVMLTFAVCRCARAALGGGSGC